jgi:PPOX class probable F420-dependent enzyme
MEPVTEQDLRFGQQDVPPTPWADALAVIQAAELFWISTVRADGRPHVTPLPAVWDGGALHFSTGAQEQKGVNLGRNPNVVLTTGTNRWMEGLDVVVEGPATHLTDDARLQPLADRWREKYRGDWDFEVRDGAFHHDGGRAEVFEVRPTKVLAFAKGRFAQTRYRF